MCMVTRMRMPWEKSVERRPGPSSLGGRVASGAIGGADGGLIGVGEELCRLVYDYYESAKFRLRQEDPKRGGKT